MADQWEEVRRLFKEALALKPEERPPFLENGCAGQDSLREEVESLLRAHAQAQSFMESPAPWSETESRTLTLLDTQASSDGEGLPSDARYQVTGEHARGGLGRILEAHDRNLRRTVALKELLGRDEPSEARFMREAFVTARLQHPSIVPVYEVGRWTDGKPFYAMKMVSGRSLAQVIKEKQTLAERLALLPEVIAVADAMAYAHQQRIIHRDLKPSNVLIGPFGETVVIDWGLAADLNESKQAHDAEGPEENASSGMTVAGSVLGTPEYMPPEQAQGLPVDERADVYAIGAILYHVLAGVPPFEGDSSHEVLAKVTKNAPLPLHQRQPSVPRELATIVSKAMSREASARYPTAKELAEDLKRFQTGQLVSAHTYSRLALVRRWLRRYRAAVALAAGFALLLFAIGIGSFRRVVAERNRAEKERAAADAARLASEQSRNQLILQHAVASLARDPTAALAWLKLYPALPTGIDVMGDVVAQALSLGVAKHVFHAEADRNTIADTLSPIVVSPDAKTIALATGNNTIDLRDVATGNLLARHKHDGTVRSLQFLPGSETLLFFDSEDTSLHLWNVSDDNSHELQGHQANIAAVAVSRDGRRIASSAADGTIRIWNRESGSSTSLSPDSIVTQLAFSPDARFLASGSENGAVQLWRLADGEAQLLHRHTGAVHVLALSSDGRTLASGGQDSDVVLWSADARALRRLHTLGTHVEALAFSPDGKLLVTGGQDRTARVWDVSTGRLQQTYPQPSEIRSVAFAPNGKFLAIGCKDGPIELWDTESGTSRILRGHVSGTYYLRFSTDGKILVSGAADRKLRLWETSITDSESLVGHTDPVYHVIFSPSGRLLSASQDRTVAVWDLETHTHRVLRGHRAMVIRVAISPDEHWVASASFDGTVRVWDLTTGHDSTLKVGKGLVWDIAFFPDGKSVACAGDDGIITIWEPGTGKHRSLRGHQGEVRAIALSADGSLLASGGADKIVRVWDLRTETVRSFPGHRELIFRIAFSPDGKLVASASLDKTVRIWNLDSGESRTLLEHRAPVRSLALSTNGRWLASGSEDGAVELWDFQTNAPVHLRGHDATVRALAFSAEGELLASASNDKTVRVWSLLGHSLLSVYRHRDFALSVAFSPNGRSLASAGADSVIRLWNVQQRNQSFDLESLRKQIADATTAEIETDGDLAYPITK